MRILGLAIGLLLSTTSLVRGEQTTRGADDYAARAAALTMAEREVALSHDRETQARLELVRLQMLGRVLEKIPFGKGEDQPYVGLLRAHYGLWDYDEPGGRWLVRHDAIVELHDRYRDTKSAEPIAWFMLTTGIGGECEGYLACYVRWKNALEGLYLRWHPNDSHANEVVARVKSLLETLTPERLPADSFDPQHDCKELMDALVPLRAAVAATNVPARSDVIAGLDKLARPCR